MRGKSETNEFEDLKRKKNAFSFPSDGCLFEQISTNKQKLSLILSKIN